MSTPDTPDTNPKPVNPNEGTHDSGGRAKGSGPTAGEVAGRSTDAARAEQARTMRERVSQQEATAADAVTKARPAVQRPPQRATTPTEASQSPASQRSKAEYPKVQPPKSEPPASKAPAAPRGPAQREARQGGAQPVSTGAAVPPVERGASASHAGPGNPVSSPARESGAAATAGTVDAPTSHIARSKVKTTGMPDLSAVQHPASPTPELAPERPEARPRPAVAVGSRRGRGPLRATMQLRSIDPWSTLKISLLLSVALFFVWLVAVGIIYLVLDGMGVWTRLNTGVTDIIATSDSTATLIGPGQVFGVAAIIGIINVVLFTAMTTIGSFIYNMSADVVGGVEVTLADRD